MASAGIKMGVSEKDKGTVDAVTGALTSFVPLTKSLTGDSQGADLGKSFFSNLI